MKQKLTIAAILLLALSFCLFGLVACNGKDKDEDEHAHDYMVSVVDPTCEQNGYKLYKCACGDEFRVRDAETEKTGHDYSEEWTVDKESTCVTMGQKSHHCTNCGDKKDVTKLALTAHVYADGKCANCQKGEPQVSELLEYVLSEDETYYEVAGIGTETKGDIVIPATYNEKPVKTIKANAFKNMNSDKEGFVKLTEIVISDGIEKIEEEAFKGCFCLTSVSLPTSVISVGKDAFDGCGALMKVCVTDLAAWCGVTFENASANPLTYAHDLYLNGTWVTELTIPDSVTAIKQYAFNNCSDLTSVKIHAGVTSIGESAFAGCDKITKVYTDDLAAWCGIDFATEDANPVYYACSLYLSDSPLTELTISDSVTAIKQYAFINCETLQSVVVDKNLSALSIGEGAFSGAVNLEKVLIYDVVNWCGVRFADEKSNPLYYAHNLYIEDDKTPATELVIPATVTSVGKYAFVGYTTLTKITLPFVGSTKNSDENSYLGYIFGASDYEKNQDYVPDSLTQVVITDCEALGEGAFYKCKKIENIVLPNNLVTIGEYAFKYCIALKEMKIPETVTKIGDYAFIHCDSLNYNEYENGYYLGNDTNPYIVFVKAKGTTAKSYTIHENTKVIHSFAFYSCNNMKTLTFGQNVQYIGAYAFYNFENDFKIEFKGTNAQWQAITRADKWNYETGLSVVKCNDGDISVKN